MNSQIPGISILDIKKRNRQKILELLKHNGPMSRKDIAERLMLTPAAVTIIVTNLIEEGIVYERGNEVNTTKITRGRKKVLIDIAYDYRYVFGLYLDRKVANIGLCNLKGDVVGEVSIANPYNSNIIQKAQEIKDAAFSLLDHTSVRLDQVIGVGVAMESSIPEQYLVEPLVEKIFGLPAVAENSMTALINAEIDLFRERYQDCGNAFFLSYMEGIQGISLINNTVYQADPTRYGHFIVDPNGMQCVCGRTGCINTFAQGSNIVAAASLIYSREKTPALYEITDGYIERITIDKIMEASHYGDDAVSQLLLEVCRKISLLIANIIVVNNPQRVILYGTYLQTELHLHYIVSMVSNYLQTDATDLIMASSIRENTRFVAGANIAIRKLFYDFGGALSREETEDPELS